MDLFQVLHMTREILHQAQIGLQQDAFRTLSPIRQGDINVSFASPSDVEDGEKRARFTTTEIGETLSLSNATRREITRRYCTGVDGDRARVHKGGPITVLVAPGRRERQRREGRHDGGGGRVGPGKANYSHSNDSISISGRSPGTKEGRDACLPPAFALRRAAAAAAARRYSLVPLSAACRLNSLFLSRSAPSPLHIVTLFSFSF